MPQPSQSQAVDLAGLLGVGALLWRGPGGTSDIDLVPVPGSEQALADSLRAAGLEPERGDPGHMMWRTRGEEHLPLDVLEPSAWPARYPPLGGVLARARDERGLLVASPEDRVLIFAADAAAGRRVAKLAERAAPLLAEAGVRDRLAILGAQHRMEALARLAATLDRAEGTGRTGRLPWSQGLVLGVRSGAGRAALRDRLAGRLRRPGARIRSRLRRPKGLLIALNGIDGAGKSSAAEAISARLAERGLPAQVAWARLGNRSRLLNRIAVPVKRFLGREGTVADPVAAGGPAITKTRNAREAERRTPVGWAWVLVVAVVNARDGRRAARARYGGVAVICDRWTADALVDLRVRYGRHRLAEALIRRALPRPDLAVLLEIDPETSLKRKPGDQADRVLVEMVDLYAELADRLALMRIDACQPIAEVVRQLHAAVDRLQAG